MGDRADRLSTDFAALCVNMVDAGLAEAGQDADNCVDGRVRELQGYHRWEDKNWHRRPTRAI